MTKKNFFLVGVSLFLLTGLFSCFGPGQSPTATIPPGATGAGDEQIMRKISPVLLNQIELRKQQLSQPSDQRLGQMQSMGMNITNLNVQRVFLHLLRPPAEAQMQDMRSLGVTLYLDSWIPPAGVSPTGFLLADMPINVLTNLAAKDYVVKLETAERLSQPQSAPGYIK